MRLIGSGVGIMALLMWLAAPTARTQTVPTAEERIRVGFFDPAAPQRLILLSGTGQSPGQSIFGLEVLVYRQQAGVEERPRRLTLGAQAVDGGYGTVSWHSSFDDRTPVTLTWTRPQPHLLVGRITAPATVRIALEASRPWGDGQQWSHFRVGQERTTLRGEQVIAAVAGASAATSRRRFLIRTDRTAVGAASYEDREAFRRLLTAEGHAQEAGTVEESRPRSQAALSFDLSQEQTISFVATVGSQWEPMERETQALLLKPIAEMLEMSARREVASGPRSDGAIGDSLDLVSRHLVWNRFYDPLKRSFYLAPHHLPGEQPAAAMSGPEAGIESLLMAAMSATIDPESARSTVRMVLGGQLADGRVPPWQRPANRAWIPAGRSMLPLGSYCVLKVYLATEDLEFLTWAYPRLQLWNDWWYFNRGDGQAWRDGNGDGLLEGGFNDEAEFGSLAGEQLTPAELLGFALRESAFSRPVVKDAKFNEKTGTAELNSAGLNALYALDTESLSTIARELGLTIEADRLLDRYQRLRTLINNRLWDEERGCYVDRHWDNRASPHMRAEHFFAMAAGLPEPEKAERMMALLRDDKRLGAEGLHPSLARDDPGFNPLTPGGGAIDALSNYLIYLGLRRYQKHEDAAALARRGVSLGRQSLEKNGYGDSYSMRDGAVITGRPGTGVIFWPAIEELFCLDPVSGVSIGTLNSREESRLEHIFADSSRADSSRAGNTGIDILSGPNRTVVRRNGRIEIECEAPVRLRSYRRQPRAFSFLIESARMVRLLAPGEEGIKITVSVDNQILGSTSVGAAVSFPVPAGTHRVLLVR